MNSQKLKNSSQGNMNNRFLYKLHNSLENRLFKNILEWTEDGRYFIIPDVTIFTEKVLPNLFTHQNYSSFVRQLHMYNFKKVKQNGHYYCYHNPYFQKGRGDLLDHIQRRRTYRPMDKPIGDTSQITPQFELKYETPVLRLREDQLLYELEMSRAVIEDLKAQNMYLRDQVSRETTNQLNEQRICYDYSMNDASNSYEQQNIDKNMIDGYFYQNRWDQI